MPEPTTCRSCEAAVIFVPSAKTGKPMILDAEPKKGVVLRRVAEIDTRASAVLVLGDDGIVAAVVDVYTDHHVTCPAAKAWAGRTRKDPPE